MAEYRITYWRDIPAQVEVFDGAERVKRPLSDRFQALIDAAAMKAGLTDTGEYLEQWRVGAAEAREGSSRDVADRVVEDLEREFPAIRDRALGRGGGSG